MEMDRLFSPPSPSLPVGMSEGAREGRARHPCRCSSLGELRCQLHSRILARGIAGSSPQGLQPEDYSRRARSRLRRDAPFIH